MSPAVASVSVGHCGEQLLRRQEAKSLYAWTPLGEASSHVATQAPSPSWQFAWTHEMILDAVGRARRVRGAAVQPRRGSRACDNAGRAPLGPVDEARVGHSAACAVAQRNGPAVAGAGDASLALGRAAAARARRRAARHGGSRHARTELRRVLAAGRAGEDACEKRSRGFRRDARASSAWSASSQTLRGRVQCSLLSFPWSLREAHVKRVDMAPDMAPDRRRTRETIARAGPAPSRPLTLPARSPAIGPRGGPPSLSAFGR